MDSPPASEQTIRWIGSYAERVLAVRGDRSRVERAVERSLLPTVIVDDSRRYVEVNAPARLAFRRTLSELRQLRIDDLTAPERWPLMEAAWQRLVETGCVAGPYEVASPDETRFDVYYYALADVLPGLHLIAFSPAHWPQGELDDLDPAGLVQETYTPLSARELEVLELAAEGHNGPMIAEELVLSAGTVRTHFENIYSKLGVRDRAAAVAKAMRLGLIT